MATVTENMVFSALAYVDFSGVTDGTSIGTLIANGKISSNDLSKPELSWLNDTNSTLYNWKLIDFQPNSMSGFAGAAFQNPSTGEIVFAFRGTEPDQGLATFLADFVADAQIAVGGNTNGTPNQFTDAENFVNSVMNDPQYASASYTFTGHSLGGGVASYMTYKTNHASTTFNGVGIGQVLPGSPDLASYNITDYVNENDVIGRFGAQMGTTVYLNDANGAIHFNGAVVMGFGGLGGVVAGAYPYFIQSHDMGAMLQSNGNGNYALATGGSAVSDAQLVSNILYGMAQAATFTGQTLGAGIYAVANGYVDAFRTAISGVTMTTYYIGESLEGAMYYVGTNIDDWVEGAGDALADAAFSMMHYGRDVFTDTLGNIAGLFQSAIAVAPVRVDPLILDLDGDGIETTNLVGSTTHFDLDANGFAERTGWVNGDDGLLALDRDGNGRIDNGQELFGDHTVLSDGTVATSGFQALAEFDENADGVIDSNDSIYSQLRVWQDANGNGIATSTELKTLAQLDIVSINLSSTVTQVSDAMNNIQRRLGSFSFANNTSGAMGEYLLNRDQSNSLEVLSDELVSADVAMLPNVQGAGNMSSLHAAMTNDTSGQLQDLVEDFVAASDAATRSTLLSQIIYKWAGVDTLDPASRGGMDARQLVVLERFLGTGFIGIAGTSPTAAAVPALQQAYNKLSERIYATLAAGSVLEGLMGEVRYAPAPGGVTLDLSLVIAAIESELGTNQTSGMQMLSEFSRLIKGNELDHAEGFQDLREHFASQSVEYAKAIDMVGVAAQAGSAANDILAATTWGSVLSGGLGDDALNGNNAADILYGDEGNDVLNGNGGRDILYGGTGNDLLKGGSDYDKYIFTLGDGQDIISETSGNDTLQFGVGIDPEDVEILQVTREESGIVHRDLEISITGTNDKVTIQGYFDHFVTGQTSSNPGKVEYIEFSNGTVWGPSDVYGNARNLIGSQGMDALLGYTGNDVLDGRGGNDGLFGLEGSDTYIIKSGYGQSIIGLSNLYETSTADLDTIQFGEDIAPTDIIITRPAVASDLSKYALEIAIDGTTDKVILTDFFDPERNQLAEIRLKFADGTIMSQQQMLNAAQAVGLNGTSGDDTMYGYAYENDTIYGGDGADAIYGQGGLDNLYGDAGNDTLQGYGVLDGGTGNDILRGESNNLNDPDPNTFVFGLGYGQDVIEWGGRDGIVEFKEGIAPADLIMTRSSSNPDDIVVQIDGSSDSLVVKGVTHFPGMPALQFTFHDTTIWDYADIAQHVERISVTGTAGDDYLYAPSYNSHLQGGDGNDMLIGAAAADTLEGGAGADYLLGYAGDDTLDGGSGNDMLVGIEGSDTYIFGRGYGNDSISEYISSSSEVNKVVFTADILTSDITLERPANTQDLVLTITDTGEKLTVTGYYISPTTSAIQQFVFNDTTVWDRSYIDAILTPPVTDQVLIGDAYDNVLTGGAGNDTFMGFEGNDTLTGGAGNDSYMYMPTHGNDTIVESGGSADALMVAPDTIDLMFERTNDDLRVTFASTGEYITIQSWYDSTDAQVEVFQAGLGYGSGSILQNTQVDQLIQAMASFSSNNNGISWSQALQDRPQDVQAVLSQYWTPATA